MKFKLFDLVMIKSTHEMSEFTGPISGKVINYLVKGNEINYEVRFKEIFGPYREKPPCQAVLTIKEQDLDANN
jgi:hypothetical protein